MLETSQYVDNLNLLPLYQPPEKMMPYIDVLRIEIINRMLRNLDRTLVVIEKGMQGIPALGNIKRQTCLKNKFFLPTSDIATYCAWFVESVPHFCVLECHKTGPPAYITTPPEIDRLSVTRDA